MLNSILDILIPYRKSPDVSFRVQKQLPYIAIISIFLLITFCLLATVALLSAGWKISFFVIAIFILILILAAAVILLRNKKYLFASRIITGILFASSMAAMFLMPYTGVPSEAYRPFAFITVMSTCNIIVALQKKQIFLFFSGSVTGWLIAFATIFLGLFEVNRQVTLAIMLVGILGMSVTNIVLLLVKKLSEELLDSAKMQMQSAQGALANLTKIMNDAREGMAIGERILTASGRVQSSLKQVENIENYLSTGSKNLLKESENFTRSSGAVLNSAKSMKENLDEQNSALTETSAAITEISANLANISGIATKRREMLDGISDAGTAQKELVKKLLAAVISVQESSKGITSFVHMVQDVASKTGLLAMNASIEAARAGSSGKGFAVIAQEIRVLSEETQKNAATIKNLLGENERTVEATDKMMKEFSAFIDKNVNDTRTLTESIDEILRGITEMDIGTREVMEAAQEIVATALASGEMVNTVVSQVDSQKTGFAHIAQFSVELHNQISVLETAVAEIRAASDLVAEAGRLNTEQVKKLQHTN